MEHFTTFLLLVAIMITVASASISIIMRIIYHHKSALWFAFSLSGLGCFLIEIIIYRYGYAIKFSISKLMFETILSFSDFCALFGGILVTYSLPRLALSFTGSVSNLKWKLFIMLGPLVTFILGFLFFLGIGRPLSIWLLQGFLFSIIILSIIIIRFKSIGDNKETSIKLIRNFTFFTMLTLPFIIIDALGFTLPAYLNDLSMVVFSCGISVTSLLNIKTLFGKPPFMTKNKISQYFTDLYNISNREKDVIELVLEGLSNSLIGDKLYISHKTVENHLTSIFRRTKVKNRIELVHLIHSSTD